MVVVAKLLPQLMREQTTSVHAEINGGGERDEQCSVGHARHVLNPDLDDRFAHFALAFHGRPHDEPFNGRSRTGIHDGEQAALFHAHGGLRDGDVAGGGAAVVCVGDDELELVPEAVNGAALAPGLEAAPGLPAAEGEAMGAEDEPRAGVGPGHAVRPRGRHEGGDHRCRRHRRA